LYKYLLAKNNRLRDLYGVDTLAELSEIYIENAEIHPKINPFPEIFSDVPKLLQASILHFTDFRQLPDNVPGYLMNATVNNLPARLTLPHVEDGALERICKAFNEEGEKEEEGVAIAFNSYDPVEGIELIYLNKLAMTMLNREPHQRSSFRNRENNDGHTTEYREITPEGVLEALWIYEYGFEGRRAVDGAYFRQVMLAECSRARRIFVARPVQAKWRDAMPVTWGEKEDLKTEIFFNSSYLGERFRIELVNRLIKDGALKPKYAEEKGYHHIDIYEVEPRHPQPFVQLFTESKDMFDEAVAEALATFASVPDFERRPWERLA
jgi:hypothetical protein